MARKSLDALTETMFYALMAFQTRTICGTEVAQFVEQKTAGRVRMGPGTLYTILAKFEEECLIREVNVEGRKRTYQITEAGKALYRDEIARLRSCVADAESEGLA